MNVASAGLAIFAATAIFTSSSSPTHAGGYVAPIIEAAPLSTQIMADAGGPLARMLMLCQTQPMNCAAAAGLTGLFALLIGDDDKPRRVDDCSVPTSIHYPCAPVEPPADPDPDTPAVPIPAALVLLLSALGALRLIGLRRRAVA